MRPQIILFGDSITEQSFAPGGWGASLADIYRRKVDVVLRGYDGYNTRWALFLLPRLFPQVAATPAAAVTIFFGANDAALLGGIREKHHVPLQEYKENLRKIVRYIKNWSPNTLVVLITPPPVDLQCRQEYESTLAVPHRRNEVTGTYADQCVALADVLGLPSINLWSKMQQTDGWQTKFLSDGVHLTAEGNAFVLNEVRGVQKWTGPEKRPGPDRTGPEPDRTGRFRSGLRSYVFGDSGFPVRSGPRPEFSGPDRLDRN